VMRATAVIAGVVALLLHGAFLLFGGLLLPKARTDQGVTRQVDLLGPESEDPKKEQLAEPEKQQQEAPSTQDEPAPNAEKVIRSLEPMESKAPALELASLSAIEAALTGKGGGEFGDALGFVSGGQIDGHGKSALRMKEADAAFNLADIDQKPRAIFQST